MNIIVKLFATLREYLPSGSDKYSCTMDVKDGSTVAKIVEQLKIPKEIPLIILVNGIQHQEKEKKVLQEGDVLSIFPPIAGGSK
jgi:molybdopterin converting factor small subunit